MYLNRIGGFYLGSDLWKEGFSQMTIDEQNDKANEAITARITQLNAVLEAAEQKLRDMKLPKDVWYRFDESFVPYGPGYVDFKQVGMVYWKGGWSLLFWEGADPKTPEAEQDMHFGDHDTFVHGTPKPYRECSMAERVLIVQHLEGLRKMIVEAKKEFATEIEQAIAKANDFLNKP